MKDFRCPRCNKLLLRGILIGSIKCPKCGLVVNKMEPLPLTEKGFIVEAIATKTYP